MPISEEDIKNMKPNELLDQFRNCIVSVEGNPTGPNVLAEATIRSELLIRLKKAELM